MTISGKVLDNATREAIENASVSLHVPGLQVAAVSADRYGNFTITSSYEATEIRVSAVGFISRVWRLPDMAGLYVWELTRSIPPTNIEAIVQAPIHRPSPNPVWILGAALLLLYMYKTKNR